MEGKILNTQNLESTEYDVDAIGNYDYRLEAGRRDALFLHGLGIVATLIATAWMYIFGSGEPAAMTYFLGFPMWISGTVIIYLIMFAIGMLYVTKWEDFPLTAKDTKNGGKN